MNERQPSRFETCGERISKYSSALLLLEQEIMYLEDILTIEKKAGMFMDSICVHTKMANYEFTSFRNTDNVYRVLLHMRRLVCTLTLCFAYNVVRRHSLSLTSASLNSPTMCSATLQHSPSRSRSSTSASMRSSACLRSNFLLLVRNSSIARSRTSTSKQENSDELPLRWLM